MCAIGVSLSATSNLWEVASGVQSVIDSMQDAKAMMRRRRVATFQRMTAKQNMEMELLLARLDNKEPFTPYSMFSVSKASLLSGVALLTTYSLVLLQFKIAEGGSKSPALSNITV